MPFQQLLNAVRSGLAPQVLRDVVKLPFQWRKNRDELRTQYGTNPTPAQRLKLQDYTDSFYRLQEALDGLLEKLRNDEKERNTIGGDFSSNSAGLDEQQVARNLRQSIEILRGFSESWRTLEHPEESSNVPQNFRGLFRPLAEQELNDTLEWLHNGVWDDEDASPAASATAPPAASQDEAGPFTGPGPRLAPTPRSEPARAPGGAGHPRPRPTPHGATRRGDLACSTSP